MDGLKPTTTRLAGWQAGTFTTVLYLLLPVDKSKMLLCLDQLRARIFSKWEIIIRNFSFASIGKSLHLVLTQGRKAGPEKVQSLSNVSAILLGIRWVTNHSQTVFCAFAMLPKLSRPVLGAMSDCLIIRCTWAKVWICVLVGGCMLVRITCGPQILPVLFSRS